MFRISDFATIFCCSKSLIEKKIKKYTPMLKKYEPNKRKHFYSIEEANFLIKCIGKVPENSFNHNLTTKFPEIFR
jgi:hypothetical protein